MWQKQLHALLLIAFGAFQAQALGKFSIYFAHILISRHT